VIIKLASSSGSFGISTAFTLKYLYSLSLSKMVHFQNNEHEEDLFFSLIPKPPSCTSAINGFPIIGHSNKPCTNVNASFVESIVYSCFPSYTFFWVQQWHLCLITPNPVQKLVPFVHIFIHFSKEVFKSLYIILLLFLLTLHCYSTMASHSETLSLYQTNCYLCLNCCSSFYLLCFCCLFHFMAQPNNFPRKSLN
jgi:hypothetical protein